MGQNMVGNVRLHIEGARGTTVRLRFAERLTPEGAIYTENLRNADATDFYTLAGTGPETWTPAFTFHGFRYVELTYLGAQPARKPTLSTIEGLVFNSLPAKPSVRLTSSSDILNKMNELGAWGQRGNFVSIPTDCPQRDERLGWMGDAGAFWRTGTYNFDINAFSHKFMLDVTDAQFPSGAFTDISPNIIGDSPGAPGWGDAGIFVPYATWLQFGDKSILEQSWPAMERWFAFILKNNPDYLRRNALGNNYADWLAPDEHTPKDLIATAYWALIAREMVEMANALNRPEDAAKYQQLYDHIATAYRAAYVKPDGSVEGNTQSAYLSTIFIGIAPKGTPGQHGRPPRQRPRRAQRTPHHRLPRYALPALRARRQSPDRRRLQTAPLRNLSVLGLHDQERRHHLVGALERRYRRPQHELLQPLRLRFRHGLGLPPRRRYRYRRHRRRLPPPHHRTPLRPRPAQASRRVRLGLRHHHLRLEGPHLHRHPARKHLRYRHPSG